MTGTTLSHYRVVSELGRGGMGIVYLGEDTKLDRQVAIKVLPPSALASDDDRARFYREAKAAAALNHPNIAQIYQIDEAVPSDAPHGTQPSPFIAMEYLDGEPLDARIRRGPMKIKEAVRLVTQIAGALGEAHEKGIVHRDVKASNVMLTSKGDAKVLDFGLALTAASTKLTRMGSTLGTIAYMSPEQARGEEVDKRTDLWALGVVLYEMLAGRNPFGGDYEQAVVYSILNAEPEPLTAVRTGVPMELEQITGKLLRKDRETRYQTTEDLIADLKAVAVSGVRSGSYTTGLTTATIETAPSARKKGAFGLPAMIAATGATAVVGFIVGWILFSGSGEQGAAPARDIVRSTIILSDDATFSPFGQLGAERDELDIDPTGRHLVYSMSDGSINRIALYSLADGTVDVMPETDGGANPVFSPDGRSIAYLAGDDVFILDISGGRPRFVTSVSEPQGLSWLKDGYIYIADGQGQRLRRVAIDGSSEEIIPSACSCAMPTDHPSGVGAVVSGRTSEDIVHVLPSGQRDTLAIRGHHAQFLASGFVTFLRTGSMFAARYDVDTGDIVGDDVLVLDDVRTGSIGGLGHYAISPNGTLAYVSGPPSGLLTPVMRMPDGTEQPLSLPDGVYGEMDLSPDERRLIVYSFDRGRRLLLHDIAGGSTQTLPVPDDVIHIVWDSPDSYIYAEIGSDSTTIYRSNLSGGSQRLFSESGRALPASASRDGRLFAYRRTNRAGGSNLHVRDLQTNTTTPLTGDEDGPAVYWSPDFSPDGRFIVYTRSGAGRSEVFMQPFPPDGSITSVTTAGGEEPFWLPDGDRLIYRYGADWYVVDVNTSGGSISVGRPSLQFSGPYANVAGLEYRVLTGGRTLLYRPVNSEMNTSRIEIITGFDRMLDELLPE